MTPAQVFPMGSTVGWAPNCRISARALGGTDCELNTDHATRRRYGRLRLFAAAVRRPRPPSLLGELQPLVVTDEAVDDSHVDVLRDPLPGQLVRGLRVTLGPPGAHRDQLVAPNHDAVGDEARLVLEDGQDAGPGFADDLLGITGEL